MQISNLQYNTFTDSSFMKLYIWDKTKNTLLLVFSTGSTWIYYDIPEEICLGLISADSAGKYFNINIRNKFKEKCLHKKKASVV